MKKTFILFSPWLLKSPVLGFVTSSRGSSFRDLEESRGLAVFGM